MGRPFDLWQDYQLFSRAVRKHRRYIRTPSEQAFLEAVRVTVKDRIITRPAGYTFWRAQRGYCVGSTAMDNVDIIDAVPYPSERMKPRTNQASEGGANPKDIPCLYGATSPDTAVAEVRPWKGELVSIGKFTLCRNVKIVECLKYHDEDPHDVFLNTLYPLMTSATGEIVAGEPEPPSDEAVIKNVWTHIDKAFSEPVTHSDDHVDYVPTQNLAELFKTEDYDGVCYHSQLSDMGVNLAFFDLEIATVAGRHLRQVTDVKIESKMREGRGIDPHSGKPNN